MKRLDRLPGAHVTKRTDMGKPFDRTNNKQRPVMTKDGRGVLIAKTTDIEGNNPKWLVRFPTGDHAGWLYTADEMEEVDE